ncbi:hypothetical protein OROHE_013153 [Orobanche hederae]
MAEGRAGDATRSTRKIWRVRGRSPVAGLCGGGSSTNDVTESGSEGKMQTGHARQKSGRRRDLLRVGGLPTETSFRFWN